MSEPSWRLGALATTAGLAVFGWGAAFGGSGEMLAARVSAWPRSERAPGASYAVQLVVVEGASETVQAHAEVVCDRTPLLTDESGYLLFASPAALGARTCTSAHGSVTFEGPLPPVGSESIAPPVRATVTGVGLLGPAPEVFFEDTELAIGAPMQAWLALAPARGQDLRIDPEPGLEGRLVAPCDDGFVLELRASYHVTGLHLEWGPLTRRERLDVLTPVSRGGPVVVVSGGNGGDGSMQHAQSTLAGGGPARGGWLALFDAHGLIASNLVAEEPWPMPRTEAAAVLVGTRGSFFDSARARRRVEPETDLCARTRALERPWPAPQAAIVLSDGVARARDVQRQRAARGRRTAAFGLAGGLVGLAASLVGARRARITARALAAFAIALTLFGILAMLLYAS